MSIFGLRTVTSPLGLNHLLMVQRCAQVQDGRIANFLNERGVRVFLESAVTKFWAN